MQQQILLRRPSAPQAEILNPFGLCQASQARSGICEVRRDLTDQGAPGVADDYVHRRLGGAVLVVVEARMVVHGAGALVDVVVACARGERLRHSIAMTSSRTILVVDT